MCSESSPSRSDKPGLQLDARLPASWGLAALLVMVHIGSALWVSFAHDMPLLPALLFGRSPPVRSLVGGQAQELLLQGDAWRLATSVLLHADGLHLTVNAVSLVGVGRLLEPWVGGLRFTGWFVAGGLGGSVASMLLGLPRSDGASGGAFALLGAAIVLGIRHRKELIPEDQRLYGPILWFFLGLNVVLSFVLPFIDATSHLGGLAVGLVLAMVPTGVWERRGHAVLIGAFFGACAFGWTIAP